MKKNYFSKIVLDLDIAIIVFFLFLFLLGAVSLSRMKVTLTPQYIEPVLTIITDYYGMQPDIIEKIITTPIEKLLKEVKGIDDFFSFSYPGKSRIVVYLEQGEDVDRKAVLIKDRLYHVSKQFPPEVREPSIYKYDTDSRPVIVFSLLPCTNVSKEKLFELVNNVLKPKIQSIQGVANVETMGSPVLEYSVRQKYTNLTSMFLNQDEVFENLINKNFSTPLGSIEDGNILHNVSLSSRYGNPEEIEFDYFNIAGEVLKGKELFSLEKRFREEDSLSLINNREVLTLYVYKKDYSNILEIEKGMRVLLENWGSIFSYKEIYNQANSFRKLLKQLIAGVFTAVIVIFILVLFFYKKVFYAFLIFTTIPLCLSGTITVLNLLSKSISTMTLAGLICGLVFIVNNSLIFIKIFDKKWRSIDIKDALMAAMHSNGRAITTSTLSTCAVFIPIFFIGKEVLPLYTDFAITVCLMLGFSFTISVFFIPSVINRTIVCSNTLSPKASRRNIIRRRCLYKRASNVNALQFNMSNEKRFEKIHIQKIDALTETEVYKPKGFYTILKYITIYIVKKTLQHPIIWISVFVLLVNASIYLFLNLDYRDISPVNEESFETFFEFNPGLSNKYKRKALRSISQKIMDTGIQGLLVSTMKGTKVSFLLIPSSHLKIDVLKMEMLEKYLQKWNRDDGFFFLETGEGKRTSSVTVYFFSDNVKKLNLLVDEYSRRIIRFPFVTQILKGYTRGSNEIEILVDNEKMQSLGFDVSNVIRFLRYVFFQPVIMKHFDGSKMVDVRGKVYKGNINDKNILQFRLMNEHGDLIPISEFCSLVYSEGPFMISKKNAKRYISLDIHYEKLKESEVIAFLKKQAEKIDFGNNSYWEFSKEVLERDKNRLEFLLALGLSLFVIYVILGIILKSFSFPALIIFMIPSVFTGSYIFLLCSGNARSAPVHLAIIMLVGLVVNFLILFADEFTSIELRSGHCLPDKINNKKNTDRHSHYYDRVKDILLGELKRKISLIYSITISTSIVFIFIFFFTSSSRFFRIFTGVLFSGLILSILYCTLIFTLCFFIIYNKRK